MGHVCLQEWWESVRSLFSDWTSENLYEAIGHYEAHRDLLPAPCRVVTSVSDVLKVYEFKTHVFWSWGICWGTQWWLEVVVSKTPTGQEVPPEVPCQWGFVVCGIPVWSEFNLKWYIICLVLMEGVWSWWQWCSPEGCQGGFRKIAFVISSVNWYVWFWWEELSVYGLPAHPKKSQKVGSLKLFWWSAFPILDVLELLTAHLFPLQLLCTCC